MILSDAVKKIKDTFLGGVEPAENSFEDAIATVVDSVGSGDSGSIPIFLCTFAYDNATNDYVCDKTYAEIESAYNEGATPLFKVSVITPNGVFVSYAYPTYISSPLGSGLYFTADSFFVSYKDNDQVVLAFATVTINPSNSVFFHTTQKTLT